MATQFSNQNQFLLALPVGHLESMAKNIRDAFEELYRKSKGENGLTEEEREEKKSFG